MGKSISNRELYDKLVGTYGEEGIYQLLYEPMGYSEPVPTIDQFIEDELYLGSITNKGTSIFPYWRKVLREIFPTPFTQSYSTCLSRDTKVFCLDGTSRTIEEVANEVNNGKLIYTLGWDTKRNEFVPSKVLAGARTKRVDKLLRITLDNGKYFDCTHDHKVLLPNNHYRESGSLSVGDGVFHFQYSMFGNYRKLHHYTLPGTGMTLHRIIARCKYGPWRSTDVVHHKDFNPMNNNPENLCMVDKVEHIRYHSTKSKSLFDPSDELYNLPSRVSHRKKFFEGKSRWAKSSQNRERLVNLLHKRWGSDYDTMRETSISNLKNIPEDYFYSDKHISHLNRIRDKLWSSPEYQDSRDRHRESLHNHMIHSTQSRDMLDKLWSDHDTSRRLKEFQSKRFISFNSDDLMKRTQQRSKFLNFIHNKLLPNFSGNKLCNIILHNKAFNNWYSSDIETLKCDYRERFNDTLSLDLDKFFSDRNEFILQSYMSGEHTGWDEFFDTITEFRSCRYEVNHKIVSIEEIEYHDWVYDIETETNNFSLEAGTIVHNCLLRGSIGDVKVTYADVKPT